MNQRNPRRRGELVQRCWQAGKHGHWMTGGRGVSPRISKPSTMADLNKDANESSSMMGSLLPTQRP